MPLKPVIFCGYADVKIHSTIKNIAELRRHNTEIENSYRNLKVEEKFWNKNRKRLSSYLIKSSTFAGGFSGLKRYKDYFSQDNWKELQHEEKIRHSYKNCTGCVKHGAFRLKKSNVEFVDDMNFKSQSVARHLQISMKTDITTERNLIKSAQSRQMKSGVCRDLKSLYTNGVSLKKWTKLRRQQYGEYRTNATKSHISPLHSYKFSREKALSILYEQTGSKNLGKAMTGKWSRLAKEVGLTNSKGAECSHFNSGQVMQVFAKSEGFTFDYKKVRRITWFKHRNGLAVYRTASAKQIKQMKDTMISSGEINIGREVCPSEFNRFRIENGQLAEKSERIYGRLISLQSIRENHLCLMQKKGLLRKSKVNEMGVIELQMMLRKYKVKHNGNESIEELKKQVVEAETTRYMVIWQDHSDIAGHAHYLVNIWFVYDPVMFMTQEEMGFDVQSIVEKPFIHIIGRSAASVADQLAYIDERAKQLKTSNHPIYFNGREYRDVVRFNSGDLPARQFEAGQSIGGDYPCICGVNIERSQSIDKIFEIGVFFSLSERIEKASISSMANVGINVDKMKKSELEIEAIHRGISLNYDENVARLRILLKRDLRGVKRLPALFTGGQSLEDVCCEQYEVLMCEPLHDLKNVIHIIFEELPHHITKVELKQEITTFIQSALGERTQIRGCDARLNLINLVKLMEEFRFQTVSQCRQIYRTLFALTEIQRLAYQTEQERCPRDVLHMYLMSLQFAVGYYEMLKNPKHCTRRKVFGAPFHSIVVHFPETYRLVSLRSIMAETSERMFHSLRRVFRQMTTASNKHPGNVLKNIIVRQHFQTESEINLASAAFLKSQTHIEKSTISLAARSLNSSRRTIITEQFMEKYKLATMWTFRRIADYILSGESHWYLINDGHIIFKDGSDDLKTQNHMNLSTFRNTTIKCLQETLTKKWKLCKDKANELGILILQEISDGETEI